MSLASALPLSSNATPGLPRCSPQQTLALLRQREVSPEALQAAGFGSLDALARAVADQLRLPRLELDSVELSPELTELVPQALAERHRIVPVFASEGEITIASCDPSRIELVDWLSRELRRNVIVVVTSSPELQRAIDRLYESPTLVALPRGEPEAQVSMQALHDATPVVNRMISLAVDMKASDIHLEATASGSVVRYRIDGALRQVDLRPLDLHSGLVSRLKVMANLDISERQAPQDGRIKVRLKSREIDLRVSILPTYWGEKVCCRILDNSRASLSLAELGFEPDQLAAFQRLIGNPYGMLLVTGPTGSGKSTTLYGALNAVRSPEINIVSVEDPIEYQLPGINQVQVNPKRGMTFAGALRSILRQDPNVILVGEIRDQETGNLAAEAALTGHLVMASLHTNDATSAITRLTEMGIEPHLLAPSLVGVVAQRLVRKVCGACRIPSAPDADELALLGLPDLPADVAFFHGPGCDLCQGTGYSGRAPVRELLEIGPALRSAIGGGAHAEELTAMAAEQGFRSMRYQALSLLFSGITTTREVLRLTRG